MNAATISNSANETAGWKLAQGNIGFQFFCSGGERKLQNTTDCNAKYKALALD
jgi:hypothetical protein